ncbi:MFS transporter [Acetobacterium malicum]|uniref:MFS transporter n=1 Tax=Acetobacterium malicum TaxID=52692 RepID=UPI00040C78F2|nr:MFS transporter [Acetobacterium dehalogenans]
MASQIATNERINMDDLPLKAFHIKITALTFGAHLTDGYVLGTIGMAIIFMQNQMTLSPVWQGLIGASALIGLFFGSLILGGISGKIGRQKIFMFNFITITLFSLLQFFVTGPATLFICRVLIGFALGGDYAVGVALLAEFAPKKSRGVLLGALSVVWTVGYVAANIIGVVLMPSADPGIWRWLLASAAIPAAIVLILRIGTPESPRWLESKGRRDEAEAIVHKYLGANVYMDPEPAAPKKVSYFDLFNKENRKRTAFGGLFFMAIVIPYFAIYTFLPLILTTMNLSETWTVDLVLNLMLILGGLAGLWMTIKMTRRGFTLWSFGIMAVALMVLTFIPGAAVQIIAFLIFTFFMTAISNLTGVYPPELFPTNLRSQGVGMCTAISRLGAATGTYLLPVGIAGIGFTPTMLALACVLAFGFSMSYFWAPETKDANLVKSAEIKLGDTMGVPVKINTADNEV